MIETLRPLKHFLEYACMRILVLPVRVLPHGISLVLGWGVAWIGHYVIRFRVRTARARVGEVFGPAFTARQVRRVVWLSWRNFVFNIIDLIRAPGMSPEKIRASVDINSVDKILNCIKETGLGAILAIPHMGAWELSPFSALAYGIPLFTMAARQKNRRADEFMNRMRQATGIETVMRDSSALKGIIRKIKDGKVLGILPDLRAPEPGLSIRFLGKQANIAGGMGFISRQTGAPVFPIVITRTGWKRHRYRVFEPIMPDARLSKQEDAMRITQAVFDIFDQCIRAEPEQWFWFNKRWILDPLDPPSGAGNHLAN